MQAVRAIAFWGALATVCLSTGAYSQETTTTETAYSAVNECTQAIKAYNESASALSGLCTDWESSGLKEVFGNSLSCQANLSSCLIFEEDDVRSGCLEAEPTAENCESFMSATNEAGKCTLINRMSASERSTIERDLDRSVQNLIRERSDVDSQAETLVSSLAKAAKEMQQKEEEIQLKIAELRARLEKLGPEAQSQIQKAYNEYVEQLELIDLELEKAFAEFQKQQLQRNAATTEAKAQCQKMASELFAAEQEQRQARNAARRNSTSLNNLTGNAQRFRSNLNKYIHECEQSDFHRESLAQIENVFKMARTQYENAQKRLTRMRNHLNSNYERNQQNLQQGLQLEMKSLVEQMSALERQIQSARLQAAQNVMLSQQQQKAHAASIETIETQLQELNASKTTYACMNRCADHFKPKGIGGSVEDFQKMLNTRREGLARCRELRTICTLAGQSHIKVHGCDVGGTLIETEWNATQ